MSLPGTYPSGPLIAGICPPIENDFGAPLKPDNVDPVGRRLSISRNREIRTLILVLATSLAPALLFAIGIAATLQTDLSDLSPMHGVGPGGAILKWSSLRREDRRSTSAVRAGAGAGAEVRVLGYMMEGERPAPEGAWVREFYLLPDAGNMFHPAHRDGDQMIAVHLAGGARIRFTSRTLVWAWGSLQSLPGDPDGPKPLYTLDQAQAQPAGQDEIRTNFQ